MDSKAERHILPHHSRGLTAVLEFETGRLDVLQIPSSEYKRYTTNPAWRDLVHGKPGLNSYYLGLNCTRPRSMISGCVRR